MRSSLLAALAVGAIASVGSTAATAQSSAEIPKDIIAEQIRRQGHTCEKPESAKQDMERSRPNAAVWELKCEKATYRVRLVPDMAANIERVD
jgi:hypothetical protein